MGSAESLEDELRRRIAESGPLSFAEVMAAALYHPRFGYYTRLRGFGAEGDFVTSPELHPAFGFLLARQVEDVWRALGDPEPLRILEIGGGSGALAESLLHAVRLPVSYTIDETSPSLRSRQQQRLAGLPVEWTPSGQRFHLVLANEVLDAQPVVRVTVRDGHLRELCVGPDFTWVATEPTPEVHAYFERLGFLPPEGGIADVNVHLDEWVQQTATHLAERSLLLVLDYGYPAESLFARKQGTLLTYYRHTMGSDPLVRLGQQDLSAHVDFTTLARAAHRSGLDVLGVTSQRTLLRTLGVEALLRELRSPQDRHAVEQLLDASGLGRIGALFAARGLEGYAPVGLVGGREWPIQNVPTLATRDDDTFLDVWREAFAGEEAPTCR